MVTYYVVFEDWCTHNYDIRFISLDEDTAREWYESHEMFEKALVQYDFDGPTHTSNTCLMCNYIENIVGKEWDEDFVMTNRFY